MYPMRGRLIILTERRSQQIPLQPPNRHKVTYAPLMLEGVPLPFENCEQLARPAPLGNAHRLSEKPIAS